jgi:heme a synthase
LSENPTSARISPWPFRLAVALALATFPLIWVGGLVTTTDAGMAVSDWPGTYGYNLFLYPWQTWLFGPWDLFIEHGHRLLGATVGLLTIALAAAVWLLDSRRWLRYSAIGALALVVFQGVLGGVRVLLDERLVAMIHGCVAPLFFAYAAALVVFMSQSWRHAAERQFNPSGGRLARAAWILVGVAYLQIVLGAMLRHPLLDAPSLFRGAVLLHVVVAFVLLIQALMFHISALRSGCVAGRGVRWGSLLAVVLVTGQLTLGGAAWVAKYAWPVWLESFQFAASFVVEEKSIGQSLIVTAHVANGALILVALVVQALSLSRRFFRLADPAWALEIRHLRAAA